MHKVLIQYQLDRLRGEDIPLEDYQGYHCPVNDIWLAAVSKAFPFGFNHHAGKQTSSDLNDRMCQHPFVLAGGSVSQDQVYVNDPWWPVLAAITDIKLADIFGVGPFARKYVRTGKLQPEHMWELNKVSVFALPIQH